MWPREEAKAFSRARRAAEGAADRGKTEGQKEVSCYTIKDKDTFIDFCVGPHVPTTGRLKAFKLLNTSNAYWKGDAKNAPMQRIYGTAFFTDKELKQYLTQIEEAKKRDHRKLGRELGLFTFHPWAPGEAFWMDKGTTLYNTLANYMREVLFPAGYVEVKAPLIYNKALWERSGTVVLPAEHVSHRSGAGPSRRERRRGCDEREADELPRPFSAVRERGPQLQGTADPLPRTDAAAP
jgi:threonyl-tRNA synthetase